MGETPLFNCKSGKDRTGQLDAEVKFLATAADESGGRVPALDESMEVWRPVRNDFVFNTGNLEMQRLNTGLPGYKLKGVPGLANVIRDGMKAPGTGVAIPSRACDRAPVGQRSITPFIRKLLPSRVTVSAWRSSRSRTAEVRVAS